MQRKFFSNLFFLVLLNILIKPFWVFGIDRVVQLQVGTAQYGLYFSLLGLSFLFNMLTDFGITNFNNKTIAGSPELLKSYFSHILLLKLLLAFAYLLVSGIAALLWGISTVAVPIFALLCLNQVLASMILFVRSNISALHHFVIDSILSVLDKFLMILFCGLLLYTRLLPFQLTIQAFVLAQTMAYVLSLSCSFLLLWMLTSGLRASFRPAQALRLLKQSAPYALLILLMTAYSKEDSVLIEKLLGDRGDFEAGVYASAYRLLDVLSQFGFLFAALLLPMFSRMLARKQPVEELTRSGFVVIFTGALPLVLLLCFYSHEVMWLMNHHQHAIGQDVMAILIFSLLGTVSGFIFGTLLTAAGKLKQLNIIAAGSLILNLVLNLVLIPTLYARGAAIAAVSTQLFSAILLIAYSAYHFRFRWNFSLLLRLLVYSGLVFLVIWFTLPWALDWKWKGALLFLASLGGAVLLRLVDYRKVISLVSAPQF